MNYDASIACPSSGWAERTGRVKRFFCLSKRPHRQWGPPSSCSVGTGGAFTPGKSGQGVKLTIHLRLMSRFTMAVTPHVFMACTGTLPWMFAGHTASYSRRLASVSAHRGAAYGTRGLWVRSKPGFKWERNGPTGACAQYRFVYDAYLYHWQCRGLRCNENSKGRGGGELNGSVLIMYYSNIASALVLSNCLVIIITKRCFCLQCEYVIRYKLKYFTR
jgi:hypothetical protein